MKTSASRALDASALPVTESVPALRRAMHDAGRAVLAAPPGSGKTTLVPLALLDEPWLRGQKIVMLEPRRVAARAAAARMAQLLGEKVGETVGYQIRFERRISAQTRIEVVTEGLLARRLQADPDLPGVGLVIFDEFHERSLDADLALALTLDARATLHPELRVLVMSATLDTERVAALLDDAPIVSSSGRLFEIEQRYVPPPANLDHGEAVARAALRALDETTGDILAFLPGAREIRNAQTLLQSRHGEAVAICPLMGELSSEAQDLALRPDAAGRRKIILATNIAQTSLTVEGVTTVVDGGLVRVARFDLGDGSDRLETQRISRAAAEQRAGRAGRLGPGVCYRLWSREQQGLLAAHDAPEITTVDLTRFALELAAWGCTDPAELALLDPPPPVHWRYARERLGEFGAIDDAGRISAYGRELARLPAAPRRAHMLLAAKTRGIGDIAAWVAATLDERDPSGGIDLSARVRRYRRGGGEPAANRRVRDAAQQLLRMIDVPSRDSDADERLIADAIAWAYPERIAQRRDGIRGTREIAYLCADGSEARLAETDPLAQARWLAIAHWDPGSPRRIRLAAEIGEDELRRDHAARIRDEAFVRWDRSSETVVAESQRKLGAIVLERRPLSVQRGDTAITAAMLDGIRIMGLEALPWTDAARQWQARVLSVRAWRPQEDWPDVSDDALLQTIDDWLAPHLQGISRRDHLTRLDLPSILQQQLDYSRQQQLQRLAPTHIEVPTGSRVRLDYRPGEAPVLAVKLQEMFGCASTPTVDEGRQRVVLELLSPAQRPIAVTRDLAGFWAGSYADVRKDLRGRYPRHPWPDDPLAAAPTRRAKPRGT